MNKSLLEELRRRKVFRAAAVYIALVWGATEILTFIFLRFGFPDWTITLIAVLFVVGFPVAMFVAWAFDIGPDGVRRTPPGSRQGKVTIAAAVVLLVAGTAGLFLLIDPRPADQPTRLADSDFMPPARSIAVLPFDVLAPAEAEFDWLGEGFGETLLHNLAQLDELLVIARTSAFSFKGRETDLRRIGRELNVATILEGSIQKADGMVRITAQLIDARDGSHLWSAAYDRPDGNVFEIQDEISEAVAARLLDTLSSSYEPVNYTDNAEAYELYNLGLHHWHKRTVEGIQTAISYFGQAIDLDPDYALAYSGLADALASMPDYGDASIDDVADDALRAAHTAVSLAPTLAEGHASVGLVLMQQGDFPAADDAFARAIELRPNYAMAYLWHGRSLQLRHRYAEALHFHRRALELDPLAPAVNLNLQLNLQWMGDFDAAERRLERTIELSPEMANAHFASAVLKHRSGALAKAAPMYRKTIELGWVNALTLREFALLYIELGIDSEADALLDRAARIDDGLYVWYARKIGWMARGDTLAFTTSAETRLAPNSEDPFLLADAGLAHSFGRDCKRALDYYERIRETPGASPLFDRWDLLYGQSHALALLDCYRRLNRETESNAMAAEIERFLDSAIGDGLGGPPVDYYAARFATLRGRVEPAIAYFTRAVDDGWRKYRLAAHDPTLDGLRDDPRFHELMARTELLVSTERRKLE